MKKLFLIFAICTLSLYGILVCYADISSNTFNITEDLPLTARLEPAENLKYINQYNSSLQAIIAEQSINLNTLNSIFYLGSYGGSFDGGSLKRCLEWEQAFKESSPLYKSDLYKGYYKVRTEKVLQKYQTSEAFDYTAFIKAGRQEFDNYIKAPLKDASSIERLMVLLQGKILDKLIELEPLNRKILLDEAFALRLPANNSKSLDYIYQMFESRVRIQLLDQMVKANNQKLDKLNHKIGIVITAKKSGELLLQSADHEVQILNVLQGEEGYRGLTLLHELYDKQNYKLIFREKTGNSYEIELEKALNAIAIDESGFVRLDLDSLFVEKQPISMLTTPIDSSVSKVDEYQLKQLELLYSNKSIAAQEIIKELNRYSIYLELKNKKISNLYTRGFEAGQRVWKKNLDNKLNTFSIGGMADFMSYIKQFELMDRSTDKLNAERILIAKFRNTNLQFRTTEEGSTWIINMLYKIRTME
ncbi:MAG TPA: hypothetical protein VEF53_18145 [Patescibacteria group bacterium]|nr:hypothetical protein [Patescibacteria group bacterium]